MAMATTVAESVDRLQRIVDKLDEVDALIRKARKEIDSYAWSDVDRAARKAGFQPDVASHNGEAFGALVEANQILAGGE